MNAAAVIRDRLETAGRLAGAVGKAVAEAIFPAKCLACGEFIGISHSASPAAGSTDDQSDMWLHQILAPYTCRGCLTGIQPVGSPICVSCGQVFVSRAGPDHICEPCLRAPKHFQAARSALVYTEQCASLVHALKYNGKIQLARPFGQILGRVFDSFWSRDDFDLIIPVPLHRRRLKARGFNQVGLMMRQWSRFIENEAQTPAPLFPDWNGMQRVRPTRPQTGLGRKDRPLNLRNAFGVKPGADISGLKLLLVDDVYTTGATANEGARMLRRHGAARVDVLTLARA